MWLNRLVNGHLERIEGVRPALDRSLVSLAREIGAVARPHGSGRPLAQLLNFAGIVARGDGGIETAGLDVVLDPVDYGGHVVFGDGAVGLEGVGSAVGKTLCVSLGLEKLGGEGSLTQERDRTGTSRTWPLEPPRRLRWHT